MTPADLERAERPSRDIEQAFADAMARFNALTPEQQAAMWQAQRESWARGMAPCEHGDPDWETCQECAEQRAKEADDA